MHDFKRAHLEVTCITSIHISMAKEVISHASLRTREESNSPTCPGGEKMKLVWTAFISASQRIQDSRSGKNLYKLGPSGLPIRKVKLKLLKQKKLHSLPKVKIQWEVCLSSGKASSKGSESLRSGLFPFLSFVAFHVAFVFVSSHVAGVKFHGKRKPVPLLSFNNHPRSQSLWTTLCQVHIPKSATESRGNGMSGHLKSYVWP